MQKVIVSGSIVYDKIMDFPGRFADHIMPEKIHSLSVCFVVDKMKVNFGGTAGNISYNLKRLGMEPMILSQAGDDFAEYKKWLEKNKIDVRGIRVIRGRNTASAHIITDRQDNQITALHLETMGVKCGITEARIRRIGRISRTGQIGDIAMAIVAPGNVDDMVGAARVYKKLGIPYIADPGQQIPALGARNLREVIQGAKVLVANDYESSLVTKTLKHLNTKTLKHWVKILVTTYGEKGSVIWDGEREIKIKAVKARKVVDPTGAGDAYRAGFIKGLVEGWDWRRCGELGAWAAKHPVEFYGTQEHSLSLKDFRG